MRVATLSLNINTHDLNYGALLHGWATQQVLRRMEGVTETTVIDYLPPLVEHMNRKYPQLYYLGQRRFKTCVTSSLRIVSHARKYEKFQQFIAKNMTVTPKQYTQKTLNEATLDYDAIVCESDVIWSPHMFRGKFDRAFFMALDSMKDKRRIAYAASLGNGDLTQAQKEEFRQLLRSVDEISVRERFAVGFVRRYTDKPVAHVVDPVLLLRAEDYRGILAPRKVKQPYALIYFPLEYNAGIIRQAKQYARDRGLRVVELSRYPWDRLLCDEVYTDAGPEEFLSLIAGAEVVFSNSFHAVCFSLLFEREFFAFTRKTGKKIADICQLVGLPDRFVTDGRVKSVLPVDWQRVGRILERERVRSEQWLRRALMEQGETEDE